MQVSFQVQQTGHCEIQLNFQVQQQPKQAQDHIDPEAMSVKLNLTYPVPCTEHTSTDPQASRLADIIVTLATPAAPAAPAVSIAPAAPATPVVPATPAIAHPEQATESSPTVPFKFSADDWVKCLKEPPSSPFRRWLATRPEVQPVEPLSSTPPASPLRSSTMETATSVEPTSYSLGSPDRYSGDDLNEFMLGSSVERSADDLIEPMEQTSFFPSPFRPLPSSPWPSRPSPFRPWGVLEHLPGSPPRFPIESVKQSSNCFDSYPELRSIEKSPINSPQAPIRPSESGLFARPKL